MPNGGVPMHMVLYPKSNPDYVIYCEGADLHVHTKNEWVAKKRNAKAVFSLTVAEAGSVAWFIDHWAHDRVRPGYDMGDEVDAVFDW